MSNNPLKVKRNAKYISQSISLFPGNTPWYYRKDSMETEIQTVVMGLSGRKLLLKFRKHF